MTIDLDRYYTPIEIAETILSHEFSEEVEACIDTTCGTGNLLSAASSTFENLLCVGIDRDLSTIKSLKRRNPNWTLSVADLLNSRSYKQSIAVQAPVKNNLLLLNPPFSHGRSKALTVEFSGKTLKASVAMAHILKSFELFKPKHGAMIIIPESVLYSDTDKDARSLLEETHKIQLLTELDNKTFKGASVRSSVIKITPSKQKKRARSTPTLDRLSIKCDIVRGALPVHQLALAPCPNGTPVSFIHTTNLKNLVLNNEKLPKTSTIRKGRVQGAVILLPRVGTPIKGHISALYLKKEVQLSDCVLALKFSSMARAKTAHRHINDNYNSLASIYRGTGARYVTVERLRSWLTSIGFTAK